MKRILIFVVCLFALLLPWRLRVLYSDAIGWFLQAVYWLRFSLLRTILRQLHPEKTRE